MNPDACDPKKEPEPIVDPVSGQKFPPSPKQMPDYGKFWKNVFEEKANKGLSNLNKKIRVDWDRWEDEDSHRDM